jgi:hypothetical protein
VSDGAQHLRVNVGCEDKLAIAGGIVDHLAQQIFRILRSLQQQSREFVGHIEHDVMPALKLRWIHV